MRDKPLIGLRVLIVEDEILIALDLGVTLTAAGAEIVGPVGSVNAALMLIDRHVPDVAVLDWQLGQETASPVAARLASLAVPFLFHTSSGGGAGALHPDAIVLDKPAWSEQLVSAVAALRSRS